MIRLASPRTTPSAWSSAADIAGHEVAFTLLDLDADHDVREDWLLAVERARMARFHHERDARRFAIRRLLLRAALGERLAMPGSLVQFELGPHGKPRLAESIRSRVSFNTSHSGRWFLIAWSSDIELGVDIERSRDLPDGGSLARNWLMPAEYDRALAAGHAFEGPGFLRLWCRKEAVMKAVGTGLGLDPRTFDVPGDLSLPEPSPVGGPCALEGALQLMDLPLDGAPESLMGAVCVGRAGGTQLLRTSCQTR